MDFKKPNNLKNPDRMMWTLEDLDTAPPPGWTEVVNNCKGNKAFPQGYQGVEYKNLARVKAQKPSTSSRKSRTDKSQRLTNTFLIKDENHRKTSNTSYLQR